MTVEVAGGRMGELLVLDVWKGSVLCRFLGPFLVITCAWEFIPICFQCGSRVMDGEIRVCIILIL